VARLKKNLGGITEHSLTLVPETEIEKTRRGEAMVWKKYWNEAVHNL
jgi:hypothetical protein